MKTIQIIFQKEGAELATATGRFSTVPGTGPVTWSGKKVMEAGLLPPYSPPLPTSHYSEQFQDAMQALADHHGLQTSISESGSWKVIDQDDIRQAENIPLAKLVAAGAVLTMPDGYRTIVADAAFSKGVLWWFEAFGREHILENVTESQDWGWIRYEGKSQSALIGSLEGTEDDAVWDAWQAHIKTPDGMATGESIARMKDAAFS